LFPSSFDIVSLFVSSILPISFWFSVCGVFLVRMLPARTVVHS
jgi:hypothetical protein